MSQGGGDPISAIVKAVADIFSGVKDIIVANTIFQNENRQRVDDSRPDVDGGILDLIPGLDPDLVNARQSNDNVVIGLMALMALVLLVTVLSR